METPVEKKKTTNNPKGISRQKSELIPGKLYEKEKLTQKQKQKKGADFEHMWKASMKYYNCFIYKLLTGYAGTPFDYVMVTPKGAYALELKDLMKPSVGYSIVRFNQRVGLEAFQNESKHFGQSFIVVNVGNFVYDKTYLVPWDAVREKILSGSQGSFCVNEFTELDRLCLEYEEDGEKVEDWIWDITELAGPVKEEYKEAYDTAKDRLTDIRRGGFGFTKDELGKIKVEFDAAKSRLLAKATAQASALGLPPPDFSVPEPPRGKHRYPTQRSPSNGPVRNSKTWGDGKGIGKHPSPRPKTRTTSSDIPQRYPTSGLSDPGDTSSKGE